MTYLIRCAAGDLLEPSRRDARFRGRNGARGRSQSLLVKGGRSRIRAEQWLASDEDKLNERRAADGGRARGVEGDDDERRWVRLEVLFRGRRRGGSIGGLMMPSVTASSFCNGRVRKGAHKPHGRQRSGQVSSCLRAWQMGNGPVASGCAAQSGRIRRKVMAGDFWRARVLAQARWLHDRTIAQLSLTADSERFSSLGHDRRTHAYAFSTAGVQQLGGGVASLAGLDGCKYTSHAAMLYRGFDRRPVVATRAFTCCNGLNCRPDQTICTLPHRLREPLGAGDRFSTEPHGFQRRRWRLRPRPPPADLRGADDSYAAVLRRARATSSARLCSLSKPPRIDAADASASWRSNPQGWKRPTIASDVCPACPCLAQHGGPCPSQICSEQAPARKSSFRLVVPFPITTS